MVKSKVLLCITYDKKNKKQKKQTNKTKKEKKEKEVYIYRPIGGNWSK